MPLQEVEKVPSRLSVLERDQYRDRQYRNDVLEEHAQRDTRNLPVQEPSEHVGQRRYSQDNECVFEFQAQERDARVQIPVDVGDIQSAHCPLRLPFALMVLPQPIPPTPF